MGNTLAPNKPTGKYAAQPIFKIDNQLFCVHWHYIVILEIYGPSVMARKEGWKHMVQLLYFSWTSFAQKTKQILVLRLKSTRLLGSCLQSRISLCLQQHNLELDRQVNTRFVQDSKFRSQYLQRIKTEKGQVMFGSSSLGADGFLSRPADGDWNRLCVWLSQVRFGHRKRTHIIWNLS